MTANSLRIVESPDATNECATFDDLWTLYPRRVAKRDAEKAWARMTPTEKVAALTALVKWRRVWMARGELQFVPHAATWLNGARWEDELPEDSAPTHASHVVAAIHEAPARGEIPPEVRAMLAKLRGR